MSRFTPCQVLPHLAAVSEDRQCSQGISATKVPRDTENGLFDRMAAFMVFHALARFLSWRCQCRRRHGCQAMAHIAKPAQRAAACASWF